MCEYCEENKRLTDEMLAVSRISKLMNLDGTIRRYALEVNCGVYKEINYCPMCGRKLGE